MSATDKLALGLDFGTESVRALLVDLQGHEQATAVAEYQHGQIIDHLPNADQQLPRHFALQDPQDWIESATSAVRTALEQLQGADREIIGIGVDFTSCTMLPTKLDGTPLCQLDQFTANYFAWPKLWKHHGAESQTERINQLARQRNEPWLDRYGGIIGLEWFFPKVLETLEEAPEVYDAADVWLEAGDWFVWQLVGTDASQLPRSTCQAGYKAMWNSTDGYPSAEFFASLNPALENVVGEKMPGRMLAPGESAGMLSAAMTERFGLPKPVPVSAATIDAHAGVPGAGASEPGTLVMVMGTSSCHMLNGVDEKLVPGVAGVVDGGILPGLFGYETGQAAVGDAFDWLRQLVGEQDFDQLTERAAKLPPGADGVLCMDWMNGCRTPLMDGSLCGAFTGLTLGHGAHHMYRALMEASAFGVRWIVEMLQDDGVPVNQFVATGGLPHHNPLLVQIYADVFGKPISIHPSQQGPALGAAILGVLAAGSDASSFASASDAIAAMAGGSERESVIVSPDMEAHNAYDQIYMRYRKLGDFLSS